MSEKVTIFEVGPRDGLQNERRPVATKDKIELVDRLSECGLRRIEVTSFVSPKWVPQMADAREVMAGIKRKPFVRYAVLTPNMRGFDAARECGVDEIAVFGAASEGFSRKNINCSIAESLDRFRPIVAAAKSERIPVRGYVSCVISCPYDGPTPPKAVAYMTESLLRMGCDMVSLGDTIGTGNPTTVYRMLDAVLSVAGAEMLAGHFHDTKGNALNNILACIDRGLRSFDSSVAGLGGCPFAPGAKGNVATEDVVEILHEAEFATGVDLDRLKEVASFARSLCRGATHEV